MSQPAKAPTAVGTGETDDPVGVTGCVAGDETEHESDQWPLECAETREVAGGVLGETRAKFRDLADGVDLCRIDDNEGLTLVAGEDELAVGDERRDGTIASQQTETRSAEQTAGERTVPGPVPTALRDQKVGADKDGGAETDNEDDLPRDRIQAAELVALCGGIEQKQQQRCQNDAAHAPVE